MAIDPKTGIDRQAIEAYNAKALADAQKNYQWTNTYQATPLPTPPVTATPPKRMLTIPKEWDLATSPILPPAPTVPAPTVANPATGDLAAMIAKDKADYEASQKPKPTVATAQNPVVVRARQDKEAFSIPQSQDIINMDKNSVYDYMDRLEIKLNKWQALSDQEQLSLRALKRREAELMKPQPIEVLNDLAIQQQKEIGATEQQLKEQDAKDLQAFAQSQDAYKQAQLAVIDQAGEESIKTLSYILGAQWTATSTSGAEAINKIRQNVALQKQAKIAEVQANIDLKESQLRKDSQETISKMKDRLYNTQLESAKYDVMNIQALNEYNAGEAKSNIEKLDALDALSQSIIANNRPLTEAEMQQSQARSESLVKPDGSIDTTLLTILQKTNPILAGKALEQSVATARKRIAMEDSKDLLDMQKVQAEINKLNAEWFGTWSPTKLEDWSVVLVNDKTGETRGVTANTWDLQGADLAKVLASWKYNWQKFFGVYATGDPDGTQFASIYNKAQEQGLENYMASRQARWSKITADMVNQASIATGIDPLIIAAKMAQDSWMGTQGKWARNNNPWNVGQFDSLDAKGITVKWYPTLEEGVLAVAENFKKRADALSSVLPKQTIDPSTGKTIDPAKATQIKEALDAISDLETSWGKESAVWYSRQKNLNTIIPWGENKFIAGSEAANFEAKFNRLRDMLTLPNLDKLKWAMSDKDIAFLRNASTSLSLNMSEKEFDKTLKQVKEKFNNMLWTSTQSTTSDKWSANDPLWLWI